MVAGLAKLCLLIVLSATAVSAGWRPKQAPQKLAGGQGHYFMNPRWSPRSDQIAFAEMHYRGLWIINADGSGMEQLSDEAAAGFGFQWSPDGHAIIARVAKYEDKYRYNAVKLFDLASRQARLLTDYRTLMPGLPQWADGNQKVFINNRGTLEIFSTGLPAPASAPSATAEAICFLHNGKIATGSLPTGSYKTLEPVAQQQYLNLVLSPSRQKVAFEVKGGHLHTMNLDGSDLQDLGPGQRPQWSPDGRYVVYMIAKDDGHEFAGSDLHIASADGKEKAQLTDTRDRLEMDPSWGPDNRLVFDSYDEGALYILDLNNE